MRAKVIYDVNALPAGLKPQVLQQLTDEGLVLYDSKTGKAPMIIDPEGQTVLTLVDTKGNEVDFDKFRIHVEDKLYWEREIYKCTNSPEYFYEKYLVYKPTLEETAKYVESLKLPEVTDFKDESQRKALKAKLDKIANIYTKEYLKDLKEKWDEFDVAYIEETKYIKSQYPKEDPTTKEVINKIKKIGTKYLSEKHYKQLVRPGGKFDNEQLKVESLEYLIRVWWEQKQNSSKDC